MLQKKKKSKRIKKKKNAWLQACFLRDVRVIWCNYLGDSHSQTYVIDNVEIVLIFHLHITFWVSHTLTSCTHHKQIFVKLCTCDYVLIFVAIQDLTSWYVKHFLGVWGKKCVMKFVLAWQIIFFFLQGKNF